MRIVVLTRVEVWGGTEINTLGVLDALVADGHDVVLVQCGHDLYDRFGGAPRGYTRIQLPLPSHFDQVSFRWWRRLLRQLQPEVVVVSKGWFEMSTLALDLAARIGARRYVLLEHHPAPRRPRRSSKRHFGGLVPGLALWYWRDALQRQLPRRAHLRFPHRIVTDSDHVSGILHADYGLEAGKTFRVHPGVDSTTFRLDLVGRARLREAWGIPATALVVGSVGRLAKVKRLDRTVRAFAALRAEQPALDVHLVLAGSGPCSDELRGLAHDLHVGDRLLLPGYVESTVPALSSLDIFLLTSETEGFGIALLEAMACERVCIATDSGGPGEILTDANAGVLTPSGDQDRLDAALLAAVALSPDERAAVGARARAHVRARFERDRQMRAIARLIATA